MRMKVASWAILFQGGIERFHFHKVASILLFILPVRIEMTAEEIVFKNFHSDFICIPFKT